MSDNKKNFSLFLALFIIITLFLSVYPSSASLFSRKIYGASGAEFLYSEYTNANGTIRFNDLEQTSDEGYIIGGEIGPNAVDRTDPFVMKLDQYGDVVWQKRFHNAQGGSARDILQTSDGGYVVAGDYFATPSDTYMWVMKLDTNGNVAWNIELAKKDVDNKISIQETNDGGFIIASTMHYVANESIVIRLDANGSVLWVTRILGGGDNYLHSVVQTNDGGFVAAGALGTEVWLISLNTDGVVQWQKTYSAATGFYYFGADSISQTSDGGFIVSGIAKPITNDIFPLLMKVDNSGAVQWSKILSADFRLNSVKSINSGYIIAGTVLKFPDGWKFSIAKLDAQGNVIWMKMVGGDVYPVATSAIQTNDGSFAAVGYASPNYTTPNKAIFTNVDSFGSIPDCELLEDGTLYTNNLNITATNSNANLSVQNLNTQSLSFVTTATSLQDELVCSSGTIPPNPCDDMDDDDGDGLPNGWEICGYDHEGDGIIDVNLPAMGADPNIKDIFVEIDYMVEPGRCFLGVCVGGHSHKPNDDAIVSVVYRFLLEEGIYLHVDYGPNSPSWGDTITWGNLSNGERLEHQEDLNESNQPWDNPENWPGFDAIKISHFRPERADIFHYALFVHDLGGTIAGNPTGSISGISRNLTGSDEAFRLGASDFVVSLGSWTDHEGTDIEQAGTFMHELGHNLGLRHGGDDHQLFEPNYLSVMNYSYQTTGIIQEQRGGNINYSTFANVPNLVETNLNEQEPFDDAAVFNTFGIRYFCRPQGQWQDNWVNSPNSGVDWNCSDGPFEESVIANINDGYRLDPTAFITPTLLGGSFDDWNNLVFSGGTIGNGVVTLSASTLGEDTLVVEELNYEVAKSFYEPYAIALGPSLELVTSPGVNATIPITLTNTGALTATVTLSNSLTTSWFDLSSIPISVTLVPSQVLPLAIGINIPSTATSGEIQEIMLDGLLNESLLMSDSVTIKVIAGPMAWFEAEPISGNIPHTVSFRDISIGLIDSWMWDFGDGFVSVEQNPAHTYRVPGSYTVSLTVSGTDGENTFTRRDIIRVLSNQLHLPIILKR